MFNGCIKYSYCTRSVKKKKWYRFITIKNGTLKLTVYLSVYDVKICRKNVLLKLSWQYVK